VEHESLVKKVEELQKRMDAIVAGNDGNDGLRKLIDRCESTRVIAYPTSFSRRPT
jgi:hypothetical protein